MATTQVEIARRAGLDVSSVNKILNRRRGPVFKQATGRARAESRGLPWCAASSRRPCLTQPSPHRSGAEMSKF